MSSTLLDGFRNLSNDNQCFASFGVPQRKWEDTSYLDNRARIEQSFREFSCDSQNPSSVDCVPNNQSKVQFTEDNTMSEAPDLSKIQNWDPRLVLNNLSLLEQKVHQLRDLVHLIIGRREQVGSLPNKILVQQQHLITADLTSIIVQLISTAGSLLPSVKHSLSSFDPTISHEGQFSGSVVPSGAKPKSGDGFPQNGVSKVEDHPNEIDQTGNIRSEHIYAAEDHKTKDEDDGDEGENLPPGSYEVLQLEREEILAPHTHFCTICGKGFKRDANLRMHMRGHGDEYKTPAALAKPLKESSSEPTLIKRYSCPYVGCKRNKEHKKFQPLKTILCVKNHYKRTHCDKSYTCCRCHTKKFSVVADLKTHEKHCGRDKWLCSCGTTFSRKDKLFGHIALFQGHTPAISMDEPKASTESHDEGQTHEEVEQADINVHSTFSDGSGLNSALNGIESIGDSACYFSALNFDSSNPNTFHDFSQPPYEDDECSFSFLLSGSSGYPKTG